MISPVMTYLASCGGSCSKFDGSTGKVWVKIDQAGYDASESVPWASKRLPEQNSTWTAKLPSSIAPGEYLLRYVFNPRLRSRSASCTHMVADNCLKQARDSRTSTNKYEWIVGPILPELSPNYCHWERHHQTARGNRPTRCLPARR